MNKVIMMGRIANELELKTTPNGTSVCSFLIAVDRNYQVKGEEKKTDFFNVVAWRAAAEFVTRYFSKGRMILVEGEMQTRQYTDKNGNSATWYEIIVDHLYFTGEAKKESSNAPTPPPPSSPTPTTPYSANSTTAVAPSKEPPQFSADDDYPF